MFVLTGLLLVHLIPERNEMWICINLNAWFIYTPILVTGFLFAEKGWIEKLRIPLGIKWAIVPLLMLVILYLTRNKWGFVLFDIVYVPLMVMSVLWLLKDCHISIVPRILTALGAQSMNIWFLHSLFFCNFTSSVWAPLIDWVPQGYLQVLWIIILCYPMGIVLDMLHKQVGNVIDKIHISHRLGAGKE